MNAILFGTGEYVTGFAGEGGSQSDKSLGVVALVHFDLRRRGLIGDKIALCGTNGDKFEAIRKHFADKITFTNLPDLSFTEFPKPGERNPKAYLKFIEEFGKKGDVCSVFTPDDTHFEIVEAALKKGIHVMATKPMVKTLEEHNKLVNLAKENGCLLQIEVHKRFDPIYNDARQRIQKLGEFNFFTSYMSQPKMQLETFKAWAGISSDISYYLNSHHVDLHAWAMQNKALCTSVRAVASSGEAEKILGRPCEDTITLTATWESITRPGSVGHAVYTASWTAHLSDVHSQQRFMCLMEKGEVQADQAHRGYTISCSDTEHMGKTGMQSFNPLYIRNVPNSDGEYVGQGGYGYLSFEAFVVACAKINRGEKTPADFDSALPTGKTCAVVTGILEAGRMSLDHGGGEVRLVYKGEGKSAELVGLELEGGGGQKGFAPAPRK